MGFGVRLLALLVGLICIVAPGGATAGQADRLAEVLRLDEVIDVLRDEGLAFGADLERDMLGGQGGAFWAAQVERIYDKDRMQDTVRSALANGMSAREIADSIAFFESALGQRIINLETSARRAIADPEIEAIARDTYARLKGGDDPRLAAITRMVEVNDLVERNVAGALNSNFAFLRGMVEGGAEDLSEAEITADVWAQELEIRADTEGWMFGFLLMAYHPLEDAELEAYISYSATPTGRALNAALFDGFDAIFRDISQALGRLVAEASAASDI